MVFEADQPPIVLVSPHEVRVSLKGVPHLMLRRSDIVAVQGYVKYRGRADAIYSIEVTTRTSEIVAEYGDRSLWVGILSGLAEASIFDERIGEISLS